jgi:hypothetical protein
VAAVGTLSASNGGLIRHGSQTHAGLLAPFVLHVLLATCLALSTLLVPDFTPGQNLAQLGGWQYARRLHRCRRGDLLAERPPNEWLWSNRHRSVWEHQARLIKALYGFYRYFGLRLCLAKLGRVRQRVQKLWWRALRRRSQRTGRTTEWAKLYVKAWFQLPHPRLTQQWV